MKYSISIFTIGIIFLLTSCTKTVVSPTSGDQITTEIQRVIAEKQLKRVYPVKYNDVFPNYFPIDSGTQWSFSNGFIQVNYGVSSSYNLLFLRYYDVHQIGLSDGSSAQALILYF
jgi:hypothetical protein